MGALKSQNYYIHVVIHPCNKKKPLYPKTIEIKFFNVP